MDCFAAARLAMTAACILRLHPIHPLFTRLGIIAEVSFVYNILRGLKIGDFKRPALDDPAFRIALRAADGSDDQDHVEKTTLNSNL